MVVRDDTPFFIAGAPRSGTTLLRDILRLHPRLECPEETHFYRWADPFGTVRYQNMYDLKLFQRHRTMDGIDEVEFARALENSTTRQEIAEWYGDHYLQQRNNQDGRWFDKTPQNVYGILLVAETWPSAKFIHIHRHPLNVVASLMTGAVMQAHDFRGAINAWLEAVMILNRFRKLEPLRLIDIAYEELVTSARTVISSLLEYLGESAEDMPFDKLNTRGARNDYRNILTKREIDETLRLTERYRPQFAYE